MSANTYLPGCPVAPMFLLISSISRATQAVVTVTTANNYIVGQLIVFQVPSTYGMYQIDGLTAQIVAVDVTNLIFTVNINSTQFDPFVVPSGSVEKPASVASAGARNTNNYTYLPYHSIDGSMGN